MNRDMLYDLCNKLGKGTKTKGYLNIDRRKASPVYITRIIENVNDINALCQALWDVDFNLAKIERTPSGAIKKHNIHHAGGAYDIREVYTSNGTFKGITITVILYNTIFVFKCGMFTVDGKKVHGSTAFRAFKDACKEHGIVLEDYAINNGQQVKKTIPKAIIKFSNQFMYKKLQHVHHIDFNHAWSAGFVEAFPEFAPVMEVLNKKDKVLSSMTLGYCQSEYCGYKYSHFAKAGIEWCNNKIRELCGKLEADGYIIVGINTDGIWYMDSTEENRVYHDENEGKLTGQWKTDHVNCELRAYSDGQYWFRENGKFNVKARGYYQYEQIKPREEWDEFDFDKAMSGQTSILFIKGRGFVIHV